MTVNSYPRRFFIGAGIVYVLLLAAVLATPDGGDTATRAGEVLADALVGALVALGIDRLTHKRMPLAAFVLLCLVCAALMSAFAAAGSS
jgi:hypothetical protein